MMRLYTPEEMEGYLSQASSVKESLDWSRAWNEMSSHSRSYSVGSRYMTGIRFSSDPETPFPFTIPQGAIVKLEETLYRTDNSMEVSVTEVRWQIFVADLGPGRLYAPNYYLAEFLNSRKNQ